MEYRSSSALGAWQPSDEAVIVTFHAPGSESRPSCLHWRGSLWHVVGHSRHWSTWRALPVRPARAGEAPTARALTTHFWRFEAQTSPESPLLRFEVRRTDLEWRLVRLAVTFALPPPEPADRRPIERCRGEERSEAADGTTLDA